MIPVKTKLTQDYITSITRSMAEDLEAVFELIQDDIEKLISKAGSENWSVSKLETEIDKLFV